MKFITDDAVKGYLSCDAILAALQSAERPGDEALTCQRWLKETPAKRMIFAELYGDLLSGPRRRVLDIGGGLTSLTRVLAARHDYTLVDLMAHEDESRVAAARGSTPSARLVVDDWFRAELGDGFDVLIANDLFPNVDQRLAVFLDKLGTKARELRLSLTYYDEPRFYFAKRTDADEILCVSAWDGRATRACLERYLERIVEPDLDGLERRHVSAFPNRRQVCVVTLRGSSA